MQSALKSRGLKVKKVQRASSARGIGDQAVVHGVAWIPIGVAGVNGLLETTIVEGEVPLLLPIQMMKSLKVVLDFRENTFCMTQHGKVVQM